MSQILPPLEVADVIYDEQDLMSMLIQADIAKAPAVVELDAKKHRGLIQRVLTFLLIILYAIANFKRCKKKNENVSALIFPRGITGIELGLDSKWASAENARGSWDYFDAAKILNELKNNPFPEGANDNPIHRNYVFYSNSPYLIFPQLHARWTVDERVVAFYSCQLGSCFEQWVSSFQPDLYDVIEQYWNELIVVVVALIRLDSDLIAALRGQQNVLWNQS
jgi:hypothetical protein